MNTVRAAAVRVMPPSTETGCVVSRVTIMRWRHEHGARSGGAGNALQINNVKRCRVKLCGFEVGLNRLCS